jgi:hypothetical protein
MRVVLAVKLLYKISLDHNKFQDKIETIFNLLFPKTIDNLKKRSNHTLKINSSNSHILQFHQAFLEIQIKIMTIKEWNKITKKINIKHLLL